MTRRGSFSPARSPIICMPTASDFPSIHAVTLEDKPSPINPLGAKGAGEGGIVPVGGVIANAVAAALAVARRRAARAAAVPAARVAAHQGRTAIVGAPFDYASLRSGEGGFLCSFNDRPHPERSP